MTSSEIRQLHVQPPIDAVGSRIDLSIVLPAATPAPVETIALPLQHQTNAPEDRRSFHGEIVSIDAHSQELLSFGGAAELAENATNILGANVDQTLSHAQEYGTEILHTALERANYRTALDKLEAAAIEAAIDARKTIAEVDNLREQFELFEQLVVFKKSEFATRAHELRLVRKGLVDSDTQSQALHRALIEADNLLELLDSVNPYTVQEQHHKHRQDRDNKIEAKRSIEAAIETEEQLRKDLGRKRAELEVALETLIDETQHNEETRDRFNAALLAYAQKLSQKQTAARAANTAFDRYTPELHRQQAQTKEMSPSHSRTVSLMLQSAGYENPDAVQPTQLGVGSDPTESNATVLDITQPAVVKSRQQSTTPAEVKSTSGIEELTIARSAKTDPKVTNQEVVRRPVNTEVVQPTRVRKPRSNVRILRMFGF